MRHSVRLVTRYPVEPNTAGSGMESQLASYPLALLKLMGEGEHPPLGMARRSGVLESPALSVPAHKLLEALITHAPSPETIAKEFLAELGKCGIALVETLGVFTLPL